jgi:glycosyltransferase involved in cell wall biosynthesis
VLPVAARRAQVDLLHNLLSTAPAVPGVAQVTTIHDVIYKRYPETHFGLLSLGVAALVPVAVRRSSRLIADSEATKNDLVAYLDADPGRIDVVYPGPGLRAPPKPLSAANTRRRLGLADDRPIVLTVSAKRPHKNLERLIDAVERVRFEPPPVLLVPGYPTPLEDVLRRRAAAGGADIRFVGWLDDETLDGTYRAATCLVFPSLAEGFGLPVVEAMARGTPVASSARPSLPEVAGDAALYFDPLDVREMATAIDRLLTDRSLRRQLRTAGLDRATRFSWTSAAEATLASYERALDASRRS